jgi:hypothetical protein
MRIALPISFVVLIPSVIRHGGAKDDNGGQLDRFTHINHCHTDDCLLPILAIQHSPTSWQKNAIDFLTENGVELDLEKLFDSDKYRRYVNRYGLPVVKKNTQENNLLEVNLLKALHVYQPITAKELVKVLDNEFTTFADRPTVNAKLYSMLSQKKVTRDDSFRWYLAD